MSTPEMVDEATRAAGHLERIRPDEQVGHRESPLLTAFGKYRLELDSAVLDPGCEVLDGHGSDRGVPRAANGDPRPTVQRIQPPRA